jgi:hypothetical protein
MKYKKLYYVITFLLFCLFLFLQRNTTKQNCHNDQFKFNNDSFSGIITGVYFNREEHMAKSIAYEYMGGSYKKWLYGVPSMDTLFYTAEVGDSIYKAYGKNIIGLIKSNEQQFHFEVDLKCKD